MSETVIGLGLVWAGLVAVVVVLLVRIRRGAWTESAFDDVPSISVWSLAVTVAGLVSVLVGTGLFVLGRL